MQHAMIVEENRMCPTIFPGRAMFLSAVILGASFELRSRIRLSRLPSPELLFKKKKERI